MSTRHKWSRRDFAYKALEVEGLGYAIDGYFGPDLKDVLEEPDAELSILWKETAEGLRRIEEILQAWSSDWETEE